MATENQQQTLPTAPAPSQGQVQQQQSAPTLILPQSFYPISQAGGATENPIQYVVQPNQYQLPPVPKVVSPPKTVPPHDFLVLALVTTILCAIVDILSLSFGVPAVLLAVLSRNFKSNKNYQQAQTYGKYSLVLSLCNIVFTMLIALLVTGLTVGLVCVNYRYSRYGCGLRFYY